MAKLDTSVKQAKTMKYLYPMFATAVVLGATKVMHAAKYVKVARATPEDGMLVG
jgi:hypothetical protein